MKSNNVYKGIRLLAVPFFAGLLLLYSGCSKSRDYNSTNNTTGGSGPGANEVWIQGSAFSPSTITVPVNTSVTWTNKDSYAHTVTSNVPMFDSGNLGANSTYSFTFTTKGTYSYHCSIHASMTATVIVN